MAHARAAAALLAVAAITYGQVAGASIGPLTTDASGVLHYPVTSPNEGNVANDMRVVLPASFPATGPRRFLYVLPVEAGLGTTYGDPVATALALGLLDGFGLVLVVPSFTETPWYADNPTNPAIHEETYFVDDIVAGIDALYPSTQAPASRLLLGFSKSGMGVVSLLLRHPALFNAAAAWDAPLDQPQLSSLPGMMAVFGTEANYDTYAIPTVLPADAAEVAGPARFWLGGYSSQTAWRKDMTSAHVQMLGLGIAHAWVDGPQRAHRWDSGWMSDAVTFLGAIPTASGADGGVGAGADASLEAGADSGIDATVGGSVDASGGATADAPAAILDAGEGPGPEPGADAPTEPGIRRPGSQGCAVGAKGGSAPGQVPLSIGAVLGVGVSLVARRRRARTSRERSTSRG